MSSINAMQVDEIQLFKKISWRLLPLLTLCYVFAYLDRVNIGFAKLSMQADVGLSDAAYGLGAGIFFLSYMLFEIPSNLLFPRIGARRTFSRIMILWGLTSAAMLFVKNANHFYVLRFLLGMFEAGFAPGLIYYLTYWYPQHRMARAITVVMLCGPIGGIFGAPISTWIMTTFAGNLGLSGWQWMFLLEGLPCVLLGVISLSFIVDRPSEAKWMTPAEVDYLSARTQQAVASGSSAHPGFLQVARDPKVLLLGISYFCIICGHYTVSFWLPTMLRSAGVSSTMEIGLYSAIPYSIAIVVMIWWGRRSDRAAERRWHSSSMLLIATAAMLVAALNGTSLIVTLVSMSIATAALWAAYTVFWAIPSDYIKGEGAAGGIALVNTIGLFGGFFSPTIIGYFKTLTGNMQSGLLGMTGILLAGSVLLVINRIPSPASPGRASTRE
ncbi:MULTISPECIES: MFS transporter [unclassified Variovorax]|uniref:MFS transporter n=1 Tax=unclassified Variovorax TaxID=663243 RepID=UPI0008D4BB29|nr:MULTISPECIES: MFS transporter [unclassified Variovorax]SEK16176.1 Sugar phosphate permease [Variovorax sp. OK202]SFE36071.1 Sugar phosphate permease [Variovorax sp. OK212]